MLLLNHYYDLGFGAVFQISSRKFVLISGGGCMERWQEELERMLAERGIRPEEIECQEGELEISIKITAAGTARYPIDEAVDLITWRLMFALGENINRIAFTLGPNLTYLLLRAQALILPTVEGATGYVPIFDRVARKLVCIREE